MNKLLIPLVFFCCTILAHPVFTQSYGCDGEFISAGLYSSLCEHPNGGFINLSGSASSNVIGFVWSDASGEISRDNLQVDNYFLAETTTLTLSGIVISDNQIIDGDFGTGDDFEDGIPSNYQGSFYTDYVQGPFSEFPGPGTGQDGEPEPDRGDAEYVSPLGEDGSYMITDDSYNGGYGFTDCLEPLGLGGNMAVFNLGADRNKIICTKVQLTAGNEYTFSVQVATVGEVTYQDFGTPGGGPPDTNDVEDDPDGDADGDGVPNSLDCCPFLANPKPQDCSLCTVGGRPDADGDGIPDDQDNCPTVPNANQDPAACSTADKDGDGIPDWQDNCPEISNADQEDRDGNGVGDACEEDAGGGGGLGPGGFGEYCIPYLELELQGVNNQNTVIGPRHVSELEFCVWTDMVRTFTADVSGEVELCIMSACPFAGGNLLAIDNLQFSETCRFSDQVTIHVDNISANILDVAPLDCNTEGVLLEGEWDAIYQDINSIEFFWFEASQNVLIEGATGEEYYVEEPGTFNFSVLNEESGCYAVFPMEVEDNFSAPLATIEFPDTISCANEIVILDATASSGGADDGSYTYQWNGVFGAEFLGGDPDPNNPIQEVVAGGTYELLITNTFNGCTSDTYIFVEENLSAVSLATPETEFELGCDTRGIEFDVTADIDSEIDPADIEYVWTLDSEVILTSNQYESPQATESGTYQLTITNLSNGCTDELSFSVTGEASGPAVFIAPVAESISCDSPSVNIVGSVTGDNNTSYSWTNENGDNLSPNGELEISVFEPGTYTLTAIDNVSGCEAEQLVEIEGNSEEPDFSIAIPDAFDCRTSEINLTGLPTNQMGNYTYLWTDANNQNLGTNLDQSINSAGTYTLQILDMDNGCSREVSINVFDQSQDPQISIAQDQMLNCNNGNVNINVSSSDDNLLFQWSTGDGNILAESDNMISVDQGGNYSVTVTDNDTGCTTIENFALQADFSVPNFDASAPNDINCDNEFSSVFVNDFGANYNYQWTTSNGNIISGANSNNPTFDNAGDYILVVTNPTSGCSEQVPFEVIGNSLEPEIMVSGGGQIGCDVSNLPVSVSLTNSVPNINVEWLSNNGGTFDGQSNSNSVLVSSAGTYDVIVTNLDNGCEATASIAVTQDDERPNIELPQPANLDCNNSTVTLDASGSDNSGNLNITWSSQNGSFIDNAGSLTPQITEPDVYTLTISNPDNGCSSTATVTITENNALPIVDLATSIELSCDSPTFVLGGGQSSTGSDFQYQWLDENLNPIAGATDVTLDISEAGNYTLQILNTATGCSDSREVEVLGNADLPEVSAGQAIQLSCTTESLLLNGSAPSDATYLWTTDSGNIVSGANTLTPEINEPGIYTLTTIVNSTNCEASATVTIGEDMNTPNIEFEAPAMLNCDINSLVIDASQSTASGVNIVWTSLDNNPIMNSSSLTPEVSEAGQYVLTITDIATGCSNEETFTIESDFTAPNVSLVNQVELDCDEPNLLIGSDENPDYTYEWTSTVTFQGSNSPSQISVSEAGLYEVLVTNLASGCEATYAIDVTGDFERTEILSLEAENINCTNQNISPIVDIDSDISEVTIEWTTQNGLISAGASSLTPSFAQAGLYEIEIINNESGCITSQTVQVEENLDAPIFDLGQDFELTCTETSSTIGISPIDQQSTFDYVWTDELGTVISNDAELDVESPGQYQLEVTNNQSGCSETDMIQVNENINEPEVSAGQDLEYKCGDTELILNGSLISTLNNYEITWITSNGRIEGGANTLEPIVSQPGTYTMLITNLDNQCEGQASITITPDMDAPMALIDPVGDLNCNVTSIMLNGNNSSGLGDLNYEWFKDGVSIATGVDQLSIDSPGTYDLMVLDVDNNCSTTTSAFIELNTAEPEIAILMPSALDCDVRELELEADYNTDSNLSFNWVTSTGNIISGSTTDNPVINAPGEYILEVEDVTTGCTNSASVMVIQNGDVPVFSMEADGDLTCDALEINIVADIPSGNFELIWTNLDNGSVLTSTNSALEVSEPGTYQLELINQDNLCSSLRTVEVAQNELAPVLDAIQPLAISCDNETTEINVDLLNDVNNYQINWTTTNGNIETIDLNTLNLSVMSGGTYTIEVTNTDNGCRESIDIIVPENGDVPTFEFEEPLSITCDIKEVDILAIGVTVGADQNFMWTTSNGNITSNNDGEQITVNEGGTYTLRIENVLNGCFEEKSIDIAIDTEEPIVTISEPVELNCTILETDLNAFVSNTSNVEVNWTSTNGNFVGSLDALNTTVSQAGEYMVSVENIENGCVSVMTIPVNQNIDIPSITLEEADLLTCKNEVVQLSGSGPVGLNTQLTWSDTNGGIIGDENNETVEVNLAGEYTLTVTDLDNTCTNSRTILVEQNMDVPTDFEAMISEPLCFGDLGSVNVIAVEGGAAPYNYSLNGSQFDPTSDFDQLSPGSYTIAIMDSEECTYEDTVVVPNVPLLEVSTPNEVEILIGQSNEIVASPSIPVSDISSITWTPSTYLSCDDCLNPTVEPQNDIVYTITIENENGCVAKDSIAFRVQRIVGIYSPTAFSPNGDNVNDTFTLYSKDGTIESISNLSIYDRWGNQVFSKDDFPPNDELLGWNGTYRDELLQPDVYVFKAFVILSNGEIEELKGNLSLVK